MAKTRAEVAQYLKDAGGLKLLVPGADANAGRGAVRARIGDLRRGGKKKSNTVMRLGNCLGLRRSMGTRTQTRLSSAQAQVFDAPLPDSAYCCAGR